MITQEIFDANLDRLFKKVEFKPAFIAVAVSGGSDSMSMTLLAKNWADTHGVDMIALTVDHRLREESADEAMWVHSVLEKRGIRHEILTYRGVLPVANIEAEARKYRYEMLIRYAKEHNVDSLFIAHNQDEQRETFFLNLARGSGLYGLCGMPPMFEKDGLNIVRPMLGFTKDEIKEYLESIDQEWVEDPSNKDTKYARVRIRNLKTFIDDLGLTGDRLAKTIENLERVREAIEFFVDDCIKKCVEKNEENIVVIDSDKLLGYPEEVALRALAFVLKSASGKEYPPRFESIERIFECLKNDDLCGGQTLAGLKISYNEQGKVVLVPEKGRGKKECRKKGFKKTKF